MDSTGKIDVSGLGKVLNRIEKKAKSCLPCKIIRSSCIVLFIAVALYVFVIFHTRPPQFKPLPPELTPRLSPDKWNQHLYELGGVFHPELASSTGTSTLSPASSMPTPGVRSGTKVNPKAKNSGINN